MRMCVWLTTRSCSVPLVSTGLLSTGLATKTEAEDLPERSPAPSFEEAIEAYPWDVAPEALELG